MEKKIVFIEEHNEAFKEIYQFYQMRREKYTLLHIDEHDDMGEVIVKKQDFKIMNEEAINRIVYEQLNVGNYILPLIYKSILKNIVWLSNEDLESYCELKILSEVKNNNYIYIKSKKVKPDGNNISYLKINSSSDIRFMDMNKTIVSLDLDYFGSNDARGEEVIIEISKQEFYHLKNDKYHKIRLEFGSMAYSYQENGRYYLKIYGEIENKEKQKDKSLIELKIKNLKDFFQKNNIEPELVIICKSFKSGYTNDCVKQFLETMVKNQ